MLGQYHAKAAAAAFIAGEWSRATPAVLYPTPLHSPAR